MMFIVQSEKLWRFPVLDVFKKSESVPCST
jgi:hypothetical protein